MRKIGSKEYNLLLIDSNVISEIVYNGNIVSSDFFNYALENNTVVCFSFYNVLELKNGYTERWEKFLDIFSKSPCAIAKPFWQIILEELEIYDNRVKDIYPLFNHFSLLGKGPSYNFKIWISEVLDLARDSLQYEQDVFLKTLDYFNGRRDLPEYRVKNEFAKKMKIEKLHPFLAKKSLAQEIFSDSNFPSIEIMFKAFYHRYVNLKRELLISDMNDIAISACIPYVDVFITEKYQTQLINEMLRRMETASVKCFKVSMFFKGRAFPSIS